MRPVALIAIKREGRSLRLMVWIAIVIVVVVDIGYVLLIGSQGTNPGGGPPSDVVSVGFVATYLALAAGLLWVSLFDRPRLVRLRPAMRAWCAGALLVLGGLALGSIGLPILVAGALATGVAVRSLAGQGAWVAASEAVAACLAVCVLVAGFEVTGRLIVCPAHGFSGGSGYNLVTGGYHWTCVDGRLDYRAGFCSSSGGGIDSNGKAFATNTC